LFACGDNSFVFEFCLLLGECVGIHVISHHLIVLNGPREFGYRDELVDIRRVGVLNETIAGGIVNLEGEGEDLAHAELDTLL